VALRPPRAPARLVAVLPAGWLAAGRSGGGRRLQRRARRRRRRPPRPEWTALAVTTAVRLGGAFVAGAVRARRR